MKILMLQHRYPNYVPDLLLHGLRKLLGPEVVDYPRKDALYEGTLGQPFLDKIPNLMAGDADVDRSDIVAKLACGFFDLVICDVRALQDQGGLLRQSRATVAVIDGEDRPANLPKGRYILLRRETNGSDAAIALPMGLPIEVLSWIDRFADTPKTHSIAFLGSRSQQTPDRNAILDDLVRRYPDSLIDSWQFSDGQWQGRDAYYRGMQSCRVVLNLPGAGYDTFRYWENAACRAAHVAKRMPLSIPNDFREGHEIVRFSSISELAYAVDRILSGQVDGLALAEQSRAWLLAHHTTERRAEATLARLSTIMAG